MNELEKLLTLAIKAETTPSRKERQVAKMQGGKINKAILRANEESNKWRSGVKLEN